MLWPLLVLVVLGPSQTPSAELATTVIDYWSALARHDKVTAMKSVYEEDLNNFLNRQEPDFKDPKIVDISMESDTTALVTVSIDRFLPNGVFTFKAKETWVGTDTGWKVRVEPPIGITERIDRAIRKAAAKPMPPELKVTPDQLVFYAHTPKQGSVLNVVNGLDSPAKIVAIEMDDARLKLDKPVDMVPPRSKAELLFHYVGPELKEFNIADSLSLTIEQQGTIHEFQLLVIYNYMSPIQRWFMQKERGRRTSKPKQ